MEKKYKQVNILEIFFFYYFNCRTVHMFSDSGQTFWLFFHKFMLELWAISLHRKGTTELHQKVCEFAGCSHTFSPRLAFSMELIRALYCYKTLIYKERSGFDSAWASLFCVLLGHVRLVLHDSNLLTEDEKDIYQSL